jgi:hypothetical protein
MKPQRRSVSRSRTAAAAEAACSPERSPEPGLCEALLLSLREGASAVVRLAADGEEVFARLPQHVGRAWVAAALERGPLEVALARTDAERWVVWCLFPGPEHADVEAEVEIRGSTVHVHARRSVELACGPTRVSLKEDGEVRVRGKEILSRASGVNRIKGGAVRIN